MKKSMFCQLFGRVVGLLLAVVFMGCVAQSAMGATIDVRVGPGGDLIFLPADVTIDVGDTVRWTWESDGHNVVSGTDGPGAGDAFFSGLPAPSGTVFEVLFNQAFLDANPVPNNIYLYHCHPHVAQGMVGSITVSSSVPAPASLLLIGTGISTLAVLRRKARIS